MIKHVTIILRNENVIIELKLFDENVYLKIIITQIDRKR